MTPLHIQTPLLEHRSQRAGCVLLRVARAPLVPGGGIGVDLGKLQASKTQFELT
ncbi:MAG: hypothetical protein HYZ65_00415 [Burkholderiales bacterium]|nr:hypothetical protein [Burkholderiales bacterium]